MSIMKMFAFNIYSIVNNCAYMGNVLLLRFVHYSKYILLKYTDCYIINVCTTTIAYERKNDYVQRRL